jgi:hypothetical protein
VTPPAPSAPGARADRGRIALLAGALLLIAGNLFVEAMAPPKDDVAWLIYVAQKWLDGGQPYVTEIEINPPPIIWFSALAVWMARLFGVSVMTLYPALVSLMAALIAWWVASLLVRRLIFRSATAVFVVTVCVLLFVPSGEFGQREHLIACLALPWLAWRVAAGGENRPSAAEGFAAGLLIGMCCGLKPFFALPFLIVEGAMWRVDGRFGWSAMAGALVCGAGVVALSLIVHPAYFAEVVPLAFSLYRAPFDLAIMVPRGAMLLVAVMFGAWGLWWLRRRDLRDGYLALILLLFATGALVVYLVAGRGWFYQRIPATVATVLAVCALLARLPRDIATRSAVAVMLLALAGQAGARFVPRINAATGHVPALSEQIAQVVREHGATSVMALSSTLGMGFPVVQLSQTQWTSRFASMWAVRGEVAAELANGGAEGSSIARRWVVDDFLAACPDIVVMDGADGLDYPEVLSHFDPAFAQAWSGYELIAGPLGVEMFQRSSDAPPCRARPMLLSVPLSDR